MKSDTQALAIAAHDVDCLRRAATEHRAIARSSGDKHTGLVGKHTKVVLDRVDAIGRRSGVADLPRAQSHESLSLDLYSYGPEPGDKLGSLTEEQVTDQDRVRVAVLRVGTDYTAAQFGLVHHVVVVQRGQVSQLDAGRRGDNVTIASVAELGGKKSEHRAESLPPCLGQVHRRLCDVRVLVIDDTAQQRVDLRQPAQQPFGQLGGGRGQTQRGCGFSHRRNNDERDARSSSGPGTTPSTSVSRTPRVTAALVRMDGETTRTVSPAGSEKYISTTTRT